MNFILNKIYKISWLLKKTLGYKRKGNVKKISEITEPSNDKKIIYSIACHTNAEQVIRLIKAIYHPKNIYYINIDLKTPFSFHKKLTTHFLKYPNIYLSNKAVDWGKWNQVQIILDIMENALAVDKAWTHFINLSGQDFPTKKPSEIMKELSEQPHNSYIEAKHFSPEDKQSKKLFMLEPFGRKNDKQARIDLLYPNINFYKGSQWMILSRDLCDYLINDESIKQLKNSFKKAFIPDESFFPTLAANSKFSSKIIWNNKRFIKWTGDVAHPETLTMKYLPQIESGDFYFARKFDEKIDNEIITFLESKII